MTIRAVRGAVQLEHDEKDHLRDRVKALIKEVLERNELTQDDVISVIFTSTPDLHSEFPAVAARQFGLLDVPLMCAQELDIEGALPRVVRILAHVETDLDRADIRHIYLGGASSLRKDLAAPEQRDERGDD
ncbi:chorismate mutase [Streptomyces sp. NPDC059479]|uniref:chorismate mutase n=1 Tax=Streptomyces sp. NPDC059479 TaxID=3346848 RepID=UPI0036902CC1